MPCFVSVKNRQVQTWFCACVCVCAHIGQMEQDIISLSWTVVDAPASAHISRSFAKASRIAVTQKWRPIESTQPSTRIHRIVMKCKGFHAAALRAAGTRRCEVPVPGWKARRAKEGIHQTIRLALLLHVALECLFNDKGSRDNWRFSPQYYLPDNVPLRGEKKNVDRFIPVM